MSDKEMEIHDSLDRCLVKSMAVLRERDDALADNARLRSELAEAIRMREFHEQCGEELQAEVGRLRARVGELEHEKADMILRNRILRSRPDLPVARAEFHDEVVEKLARLARLEEAAAKVLQEYEAANDCPLQLGLAILRLGDIREGRP
jgi:hypothetical protein